MKVGKKKAPAKDKSLAIYMVQPWHRTTRQKVTQSFARVSEITFLPLTTNKGTEGPLVIEAEIGGHMIHRMYVDGGSSTKVLYEHCFNRLRPEIKSKMVPATTSLIGFSGETIWPLGQLRLLVTIGDADHATKAWMNFMIVRSLSPYNVITSSKEILKEAEVRRENFKIALHPNFPDQEVAIGGTLSAKGRTELCSLLKENLDIFSWQPSDMTGVPRSVAEQRLNIREGYSPVRQKKRARPWNVPKPSKRRMVAGGCYHQIQMAESDEEKTAFHTSQGVYCYTKMPFGLKNVGATYQRLVDKAFDSQISRNIEVYIDDLVIKSYTEAEMLRDIDETFCTLRRINMKLNPKNVRLGQWKECSWGTLIAAILRI
ncbi:reverse transcriptase domain-containing protein [Tanacetum coccineum]